jgi:hypothetical protein
VKPPLIAPLPFGAHTSESWMAYVKSLKQEPEAASSGLFLSVTKKGKASLRVTRDPKIATQTEIEELARAHGLPIAEVYILAKSKLSLIKESPAKGKKK